MSPKRDAPPPRPGDDSHGPLAGQYSLLGGIVLLVGAAVVAVPVAGLAPLGGASGDGGPTSDGAGVPRPAQTGSAADTTGADVRRIEYGQTVSGRIDADDPRSEAYRGYHEPIVFRGSAGDTVHVSMAGEASTERADGAAPDPYLLLVGPDGGILARGDDTQYGVDAAIRGVVLPGDGAYTLVATSFDATATFGYTLRLENASADPADLRSIEPNSTANGAVDKTDPHSPERNGVHEPVTFEGAAGAFVDVDMGSRRGDSYLQLLGPNGTVLAENDDSAGLNASVETTLPTDGTYTIVATGFGEHETFPYTLSLSVSAERPGGLDLREIRPGQTRQGELDAGDPRAAFVRGAFEPVTFAGESGQSVTIDMRSDDGNTYLLLYGPDGGVVARNDDADGSNARVETTLRRDGEYTVVATSADPAATFAYELSLSVDTPTEGDEAADLRNISYGERRSGAIEESDPSARSYRGNYEPVTFEGAAGNRVVIAMTAEEDGYLVLVSPNGTVLAENDDARGFDPRIETTLPADGRYTIVATSFDPGAAFPYGLSLRQRGAAP